MRIGILAEQLGTTPHAIRFYERRGLLPAPPRGDNHYREYGEGDAERLRLLIGLRQLDIPLDQAAELATMCAAGRCGEVSDELRTLLAEKRQQLAHRVAEMHFLDQRMAPIGGWPHTTNAHQFRKGGRACPCVVTPVAVRSTAAAAAPSSHPRPVAITSP